MALDNFIAELNNKLNHQSRANCFNAVQLYWRNSKEQRFTGPQEFVEYIAKNFKQVKLEQSHSCGDVSIVWSRRDWQLPLEKIDLTELAEKREGYPFELVIEHSFVHLSEGQIFQKPDPKFSSKYQAASFVGAISPYKKLNGFELPDIDGFDS
jgi:hypothetical protein